MSTPSFSSTSVHSSTPASQSEIDATYRKVTIRLIPFLVFLFILAWIDRVNIGFAKLQMLQDLHFSEAVYGLGAGIFFIGYFLFEVPSNLLLEKIGARATLARITILWGLTSMAMIFVHSATSFYILRFLLGAFEAGFFPGVVLYLTYWFPSGRRARINGLFMTSFAIAGIIGNPIAGLIMKATADLGGLANWEWLFLFEGLPSVIAGFVVLAYLPKKPDDAKWLTESERAIVQSETAKDAADPAKRSALKDAFNARVWLCAAIYFCLVAGNATIAFWTPSIIKALGVQGNLTIGLVAAIPFIAGTIAMVWAGAHSDRTGERRLHCVVASIVATAGLIGTGYLLDQPHLALIALTVAAIGILAAFPVFWALPSAFLTGTAAAGGIALINSIGNLAGFVAPYTIGWLKDTTGKLSAGLYFVGVLELGAAVLILAFIRVKR